jgi:hypothetical protein
LDDLLAGTSGMGEVEAMQPLTRSMLIAATALGTGIGMGWIWRVEREEAGAPASRGIQESKARLSDRAKRAQADAQGESKARVVTELERMEGLTVSEFAVNMADAWMDYGDPDNHLKKALFLSACDAERATAFYLEFKRRNGLKVQDNAMLQEFFTIVGKRDGKEFMEQLLAASPEGVPEIDNVVHGWAVANPQQAVDWLNTIPDGSPYYGIALKGLIWGLAESSPSTAVQVYEQLDAADRNGATARNLILGTLQNHGMKGIYEMVTSAGNEENRRQFLAAGMESGTGRPPAEYVKWMAEPLESAPDLRGHFERMASRWAANAPDEAMNWLMQNGLGGGGRVALSSMAASLVRTGKGAEVDAWLAANPNAPGRSAIQTGKLEASTARQ